MKVWLLWEGEYSDSTVIAIYSTLELARAAAALYKDSYLEDENGREVDGDAVFVRAGTRCWVVWIDLDTGTITRVRQEGIGTGQPPITKPSTLNQKPMLSVRCDAPDKETAIKIAGDERAKFIALTPLTE